MIHNNNAYFAKFIVVHKKILFVIYCVTLWKINYFLHLYIYRTFLFIVNFSANERAIIQGTMQCNHIHDFTMIQRIYNILYKKIYCTIWHVSLIKIETYDKEKENSLHLLLSADSANICVSIYVLTTLYIIWSFYQMHRKMMNEVDYNLVLLKGLLLCLFPCWNINLWFLCPTILFWFLLELMLLTFVLVVLEFVLESVLGLLSCCLGVVPILATSAHAVKYLKPEMSTKADSVNLEDEQKTSWIGISIYLPLN